jgi:transcriptional regulator with XRE-family HTH domain
MQPQLRRRRTKSTEMVGARTPKAPDKGLGERLRQAREGAGLSAAKLSELTDGALSRQAIGKIEAGAQPSARNLFILADALKTDPRELVFGTSGGAHLTITRADAPSTTAPYAAKEVFDEETLRFARRFAELSPDQRRAWMLGMLLNGRHVADERVEKHYPTPKKKP